jgi:hypothetical protein
VLKNPSYSPELQAPWIQMVIASSAYNAWLHECDVNFLTILSVLLYYIAFFFKKNGHHQLNCVLPFDI